MLPLLEFGRSGIAKRSYDGIFFPIGDKAIITLRVPGVPIFLISW